MVSFRWSWIAAACLMMVCFGGCDETIGPPAIDDPNAEDDALQAAFTTLYINDLYNADPSAVDSAPLKDLLSPLRPELEGVAAAENPVAALVPQGSACNGTLDPGPPDNKIVFNCTGVLEGFITKVSTDTYDVDIVIGADLFNIDSDGPITISETTINGTLQIYEGDGDLNDLVLTATYTNVTI